MKLYLYAIHQGAVCLYVGIAFNPMHRFRGHRSTTLRGVSNATLRTLRPVSLKNGPRIEGQVIRAYKRRGQAAFKTDAMTDEQAAQMGGLYRTPLA